jgi:Family of unknown function (DUF5681)
MSARSEDDRVGRNRPPRKTRWKKGQSGNVRKQKPKRPESALAVVDRLLLAPTPIKLDGEARRIAAIEAIVFQLLRKAMSGNAKAFRVLLKYKQFANQSMKKKLDLAFVDNAYTQAVGRMAKHDE